MCVTFGTSRFVICWWHQPDLTAVVGGGGLETLRPGGGQAPEKVVVTEALESWSHICGNVVNMLCLYLVRGPEVSPSREHAQGDSRAGGLARALR